MHSNGSSEYLSAVSTQIDTLTTDTCTPSQKLPNSSQLCAVLALRSAVCTPVPVHKRALAMLIHSKLNQLHYIYISRDKLR